MRTTPIGFLIFLLLGLGVACQSQPDASNSLFAIPSVTPGNQSVAPTPITPAASQVPYAILDMPHCQGITDLKSPLKFDWPNIDDALEKLADYNWGYYTCAIPQPELLAFLRDGMPKPPYLWREVNHADYAGGTVVLFYHSLKLIWIYLWILPGPDAQSSYMIIAKSDAGRPQTWECRQILPGIGNPASLGSFGFGSHIAIVESPSHYPGPIVS